MSAEFFKMSRKVANESCCNSVMKMIVVVKNDCMEVCEKWLLLQKPQYVMKVRGFFADIEREWNICAAHTRIMAKMMQ